MSLKLSKKELQANGGITLIALVITIIVLLILAGVAIATLTGDNGLLTKATGAKETSTNREIEEEIRLAWNKVYMDSYLDSTTDKAKALLNELKKTGHTDENTKVTANGTTISIEKYRGKDMTLDVTTGTLSPKEPLTVAKAKLIEKFDDNTPITDEYGNTFIVPKGFKISSDSADNVTEGIVIEDATYTNTIGSEFVWIPVSKDNKKIVGPAYSGSDKIEKKEVMINLGRYTFNDDGSIDVSKTDGSAMSVSVWGSTYDFTENSKETETENAKAKDISSSNGFTSKTNEAGGFWIGRYEARIEGYSSVDTVCPWNDINWVGYSGGRLVEKPGAQVFNYITQKKASELSQKMYEKENDGTTAITKFESDLINSFAWDTATLFLQEFGWKNYSRQTSINSIYNVNGTVLDSNKDNPCKVYDMASNCYEWTTENCSYSGSPCVSCGGIPGDYTSFRTPMSPTLGDMMWSFRPILYIK